MISHAALVGMIKKGSEAYNAWRQQKQVQLEKIEMEKNATVFDKLKAAARSNTLFDKLKYAYDKGNN